MPFRDSSKLLSPREERQFTEPVVRFRRIRGRIVPIVNKKRAGEISNTIGNKSFKAGAALSALGIGKRFLKKKGVKFSLGTSKLINKLPRRTRAVAKVAILPIKFAAKHPIKLGAAFAVAGLVLKSTGFDLEAHSEFGFDIGAKRGPTR